MTWVLERDLAQDAKVRLFCLPHAGSGAAGFYRWKRLLPSSIAVCPVMLPGRESRLSEAPMLRVEDIVAALHDAVEPSLQEPYAIFGHSMGALLAFEWARLIQHKKLPAPRFLFASGRNAPQMPFGHRELHLLGDEEFAYELSARYGGTPETLLADPELRQVFLPILRADLTVVETYGNSSQDELVCRVRAFAGIDDPSVSDEGLARWADTTGADFGMRRFPGDHFYHLDARQQELLKVLIAELADF